MLVDITQDNNSEAIKRSLKTLLLSAVILISAASQFAYSYVYKCDAGDTSCVTNYNKNAIEENQAVQKYNLVRIVMPGRTTPEMARIKSSARWLGNFYNTASQGQLRLRLNKAVTKEVEEGTCKQAKNEANTVDSSGTLFSIRV
ncbi:MAG TPA: hypothetical protein VL091_00515, partial [Marinobacter sp.]|nr:hypothetical protein [Marinobacter sp.]